MSAPSAKGLLDAATGRRKRAHPAQVLMNPELLPEARKTQERDQLDFDPTPPSTTRAILRVEAVHMRAHGNLVWENAVGAGHIARVLAEFGFEVVASDVVDRGWPGVELRNFRDYAEAPAKISFTNPAFNMISAQAADGFWLWHSMALGLDYVGLLLNAQWPFAAGHAALLRAHPPSIEYVLTWRPDFRGGGQSPMSCCFFVWDVNRPALGPETWVRRRLYLDDPDAQGVLL
jgi:hypothetical protein